MAELGTRVQKNEEVDVVDKAPTQLDEADAALTQLLQKACSRLAETLVSADTDENEGSRQRRASVDSIVAAQSAILRDQAVSMWELGDEVGAQRKIAEAIRFDPNDTTAVALQEKLRNIFGDTITEQSIEDGRSSATAAVDTGTSMPRLRKLSNAAALLSSVAALTPRRRRSSSSAGAPPQLQPQLAPAASAPVDPAAIKVESSDEVYSLSELTGKASRDATVDAAPPPASPSPPSPSPPSASPPSASPPTAASAEPAARRGPDALVRQRCASLRSSASLSIENGDAGEAASALQQALAWDSGDMAALEMLEALTGASPAQHLHSACRNGDGGATTAAEAVAAVESAQASPANGGLRGGGGGAGDSRRSSLDIGQLVSIADLGASPPASDPPPPPTSPTHSEALEEASARLRALPPPPPPSPATPRFSTMEAAPEELAAQATMPAEALAVEEAAEAAAEAAEAAAEAAEAAAKAAPAVAATRPRKLSLPTSLPSHFRFGARGSPAKGSKGNKHETPLSAALAAASTFGGADAGANADLAVAADAAGGAASPLAAGVATAAAAAGAAMTVGGLAATVAAEAAAATLRRKGMQCLVDGDHAGAIDALGAALERMPHHGRGTDIAELHGMLLARSTRTRTSSRDRIAG